jgi:hypothetical protein
MSAWNEVIETFASDPNISLGTADCYNYPDVCADLTTIADRPVFVAFSKIRYRKAVMPRTVAGFTAQIESLKGVDFRVPCPLYPDEFDHRYPFFVYESHDVNDTTLCKTLRQMQNGWFRDSTVRFYYKSRSTQNKYLAHITEQIIVPYKGTMHEFAPMTLFTKDYIMMPFSNWRLEDAMLSSRRFVFLVHNGTFDQFVGTAFDVIRDFIIGQLHVSYFRQAYPRMKIVTPALVASDVNKSSFMLFNDVDSVPRFREILLGIRSMKYEPEMDLKLPKLFPRLDEKWKFELDTTTGILWVIAVGSVLLLILVIVRTINRPVPEPMPEETNNVRDKEVTKKLAEGVTRRKMPVTDETATAKPEDE